jgi:hypothetical protein
VPQESDVVNTDDPDGQPVESADTLAHDASEPDPAKESNSAEDGNDTPESIEAIGASSDADVTTDAKDQASKDGEAEPPISSIEIQAENGDAADTTPITEISDPDHTTPTDAAAVEASCATTEDIATEPNVEARESSPGLPLEASRAEETAEITSDALQEATPQENTPDSTKKEEFAALATSGKCKIRWSPKSSSTALHPIVAIDGLTLV